MSASFQPPSGAAIVDHLARIYDAGANVGDGEHRAVAMMKAVERATAELIGHQLFTALVVHHQTMEVERLFSNMPDAYPVAGRKKKRDTWWGRKVIEAGEPFVGTGPGDLEKAFADHELIRSLGLNCIINIPLVHAGKTAGTVNLVHGGEHYSEAQVPLARCLCMPLLPIMLAQAQDPA